MNIDETYGIACNVYSYASDINSYISSNDPISKRIRSIINRKPSLSDEVTILFCKCKLESRIINNVTTLVTLKNKMLDIVSTFLSTKCRITNSVDSFLNDQIFRFIVSTIGNIETIMHKMQDNEIQHSIQHAISMLHSLTDLINIGPQITIYNISYDIDKLKQIYTNLLNIALEFAQSMGTIKLSVAHIFT